MLFEPEIDKLLLLISIVGSIACIFNIIIRSIVANYKSQKELEIKTTKLLNNNEINQIKFGDLNWQIESMCCKYCAMKINPRSSIDGVRTFTAEKIIHIENEKRRFAEEHKQLTKERLKKLKNVTFSNKEEIRPTPGLVPPPFTTITEDIVLIDYDFNNREAPVAGSWME